MDAALDVEVIVLESVNISMEREKASMDAVKGGLVYPENALLFADGKEDQAAHGVAGKINNPRQSQTQTGAGLFFMGENVGIGYS